MQAIVLAGGFAKRLWPLTKETPKPLLPVGGRPIIEHILEKLVCIPEIEKIIVSVNSKFEKNFTEWSKGLDLKTPVEIVTEPSKSEEEKFGAIGALEFVLNRKAVNGDLLVVAGDNIFDFEMGDFLECNKNHGSSVVAFYDMGDIEKIRNKYGVAVLDGDGKVMEFQEKPAEPKTTLVSTGCYFFPGKVVSMIHDYLRDGNNPDAPGFFISWLHKKVPVQGFVFSGRWFDIGCIESYQKADREFSKK